MTSLLSESFVSFLSPSERSLAFGIVRIHGDSFAAFSSVTEFFALRGTLTAPAFAGPE
ncbi:MAG: hypothetical protein ABJA66_19220 [Actinomycetota bacterium]